MKKTMWVGMVGMGNSVVVGFDGEKVRCASTSPEFEEYVLNNVNSERVSELAQKDEDFNYPLYVGTSTMMSFGEEVPWDEEGFKMLSEIARALREKKQK